MSLPVRVFSLQQRLSVQPDEAFRAQPPARRYLLSAHLTRKPLTDHQICFSLQQQQQQQKWKHRVTTVRERIAPHKAGAAGAPDRLHGGLLRDVPTQRQFQRRTGAEYDQQVCRLTCCLGCCQAGVATANRCREQSERK